MGGNSGICQLDSIDQSRTKLDNRRVINEDESMSAIYRSHILCNWVKKHLKPWYG